MHPDRLRDELFCECLAGMVAQQFARYGQHALDPAYTSQPVEVMIQIARTVAERAAYETQIEPLLAPSKE